MPGFGSNEGFGGGGESGGFMAGLGNLFKNKLFQQYLSSAGASLEAGKGLSGLNEVTQQNISSQNYMKLLKRMLGGDVPEGGKVVQDGKGTKIEIPKSALGSMSGEGGAGNGASSQNPTFTAEDVTNAGMQDPNEFMKGVMNPFASASLESSSADLAGVTPEMISQALQFKMNKEQLRNQSISQAMDDLYKMAMIQESRARTAENAPVFTVPGTDIKLDRAGYIQYQKMKEDDKSQLVKEYEDLREAGYEGSLMDLHREKKLPADIVSYEYAQKQGFGGSLEDWKNSDKTPQQKNYAQVKAEGKFKGSFDDWLVRQAREGRTIINLDTKLTEKKAMADLSGQLYFKDVAWKDDIDEYVSSDGFKRELRDRLIEDPDASPAIFTNQKVKEKIEGKIKAGGGTITNMTRSGKEVTWTVKWKNGDEEKIVHGFR